MLLSDLFKDAAAAADDAPSGERWEPPAGLVLTVKVVNANGDDTGTKAGYPKFGFLLEVVDGEHQGKSFWDNVYFSAHAGANKRSFAKLSALGFDETWWAANPGSEATAAASVGREFAVHTAYQKLKDGQTKPFPEHKWEAKKAPVFSPDGGTAW